MKHDKEIFVLIKDILDTLCSSSDTSSPRPRKAVTLHVSRKDDEWNKFALEVARTLQSNKPCPGPRIATESNELVINLSDDNSNWNALALAFAERDRKRQQRRQLKEKSSNNRIHTYG